jgi:hypothetical protein
MLADGLTLLGNSEITNVQIEQVTAFPTTNLGQGRLIYLSVAVGGEQPGLYISEANSTWVPVGNITDLVAGTGMIVNTVNGISTLSVNTAVLGAVIYQGTWNALTNTPTLTSSVGTKGQYYTVSVGGTRDLDGSTVFQIGDMVIYSGTSWDKIDGAANEVRSVAGRTGDVLLSTADLAEASNLFYTDARARAALSVTGGALSYNQATGVLSSTATSLTSSAIITALTFTPANSSTLAQPNGIATLDSSGKLPTAQIPAALVGALQYQGAWDPSTNTPILTPSVGTKGQYYKVSTAATGYAKTITTANSSGTNATSIQLSFTPSSIAVGDTITINGGTATITALNSPSQSFQTFTPALSFSAGQTLRLGSSFNGLTQFAAGDIVAFNGSTWDGIDGSSSEVLSVAGRTGAVVLTAADVSALALSGGTLSGGLTVASSYVAPTYNTWSSSNLTNGATINGLVATTGSNASNYIRSTIGLNSGKYFWEVTITSGGSQNPGVGIIIATAASTLPYQYIGAVGDIIGLALDFSTNTLKYYKNSVIVQTDTIVPGTYYAGVTTQSAANAVFTANFGASSFVNAVPAGFTSGLYTGGITGGITGLVQTTAQPGITSVGTLSGLVLSADPIANLGAATKQYVDTRIVATSGVQSVAGRTGAVVLTTADVSGAAPLASPAFTGTITVSGNLVIQSALEKVSITATAPAAITHLDISTAAIWNFTVAATANFTMNVRGNSTTTLDSIMSIGQSLSVAVLVLNGATAFYPTAYTIDGVAVTPKWNGTAPTAGSASAIDSYSITFIKTAAGTFTVLATVAKFA